MTFADLIAVLTFQAGFNTAVVLAGVIALGAGGGVIGTFTLLRRRALVSDAISHATLPGVACGFLAALALGGSGRSLPVLLAGAAVSGAAGVLIVQWIRDHTRLPEDTAIGTVLSVFFGAGIVLLSWIQSIPAGGQAGLGTFLLGSTAGMSAAEAELIALFALAIVVAVAVLFKPFAVLAFDEAFARAAGLRATAVDLAMMALLLAVVCIGLRTVGLVLIIALVIVPPVAARFWTERLGAMVAIAAGFGAAAGYVGGALSALLPDMPAGAVIVLVAGALFAASLLFAPARGLVAAALRRAGFRVAVARRQGLVRLAVGARVTDGFTLAVLRLSGHLDRAGRLTARGRRAADEARRQQALWDRLLADHPEDAFALRAWSVGRIEDALPADLVAELARRGAAEPG